MATTAKFYGRFLQSLFNKEIDFDSDTIKVMLCTAAYTPDQDAHRYKSDVTNEITGSGYTAGGIILTSPTITYDAANNRVTFDAADSEWNPATFAARHVVIYDATPGSDSTRPLICYMSFDSDVSATAAPFRLIWDAVGICSLSVS